MDYNKFRYEKKKKAKEALKKHLNALENFLKNQLE